MTPDRGVHAMSMLKNPAYSQVQEELDRLSRIEDDVEMRYVIEQCGSFVLPDAVRYLVDRLRWRFDAFDWEPDTKGRFA